MTRPTNQGRGRPRIVAAAVVLTAVAVQAAACSALPSTAAPALPAQLSSPRVEGGVAAQLAALPVAAEDTGAHYDRDDWPHWSEGPGGCDTRETVLRGRGQNVTTGRGCRITGGEWTSAYDGVIVRARTAGDKTVWEPQGLDLDHVVPLAEVARSGWIVDGRRVGPRQWTRDQREQYANDQAGLVPVTASSNRVKGDQDPAKWLPDRDRCAYVAGWVETKQRYELSVDQAEHDAIAAVLAACERG